MATAADWRIPVWSAQDAVGVDKAPEFYNAPAVRRFPNHSGCACIDSTRNTRLAYHTSEGLSHALQSALFFIVFTIIGGFFALSLFIAALMDQFHDQAKEVNGSAFLDEKQNLWCVICVCVYVCLCLRGCVRIRAAH